MKVIRDGGDRLYMIPLFCDWGIRRCNQEGCREKPTTIVVVLADESPTGASLRFGLCEEHYQAGNQGDGGFNYTLIFDDYDAWKGESDERV